MLRSPLHKLGWTNKTRRPARPRWSALPRLEALEDRAAPASFQVTSLANTGAGTLRQAITDANASMDASSTITFQAGLSGSINLTSALPTLSKNITIDGPGAATVNIRGSGSGVNTFRLFDIAAGKTCVIDDLTLSNAVKNFGAGIYNEGTLFLYGVTLTENRAASGGAIFNTGNLTVSNCFIHENTASLDGGGIYNTGTLAICCATEVSNNDAGLDGGGVYNTGTCSVADLSEVYGNIAKYGAGVWTNGTFEMDSGRIYSNTASEQGGGILSRGTSTLTSVDTEYNTAKVGGGFCVLAGALSLVNGTLSGNTATQTPGTAGGAWQAPGSYTATGVTITDAIAQI